MRDEAFARGLADEDGAVVIHADHRRGEDAAQGVFDELRLAVVPVGDEAVVVPRSMPRMGAVFMDSSVRGKAADYSAVNSLLYTPRTPGCIRAC